MSTSPYTDGREAVSPSHESTLSITRGHLNVLLQAVSALSMARSMDRIAEIVRRCARELAEADGATFVLRDGTSCYYLDEDAIAPLWKGKRFPMETCISGWAMHHRESVAIADALHDIRVPREVYEPTFVKSLLMVPIRQEAPLGAIGVYWAHKHEATPEQRELLQALANSTSLAMESVELHQDLERRVRERTAEIRAANEELEAFAAAVSQDPCSPLNAIDGFNNLLERRAGQPIDFDGEKYLQLVRDSTMRTTEIVTDLLSLSQARSGQLQTQSVDLAELARQAWSNLQTKDPARAIVLNSPGHLPAIGDPGLLRIALDYLLSNAWHCTSQQRAPIVTIGAQPCGGSGLAYFVRDNGHGFGADEAPHLFEPRRPPGQGEMSNTVVGLTTVKRIVERHGGQVWAESEPGRGATYWFTLGASDGA